jgi:serine/threonine protein kinase
MSQGIPPEPSPGDGPLHPTLVLDLFEEAWEHGREPRLADFLVLVRSGRRRELLEELIKIDLERRWRFSETAGHKANHRPLEDYLSDHPELGGTARCPVELIVEEYRVRRRWGDRPSHEDYAARFPAQAQQLPERLRQVDVQLAAEYAPVNGKRLPPSSHPNRRAGSSSPRPVCDATPLSCAGLLEACRRFSLLMPGQMNELYGGGLSDSKPRSLARELMRRGWLTGYQVNRLLQGQAEDLRIGQYLVVERLGAGATGQVFKARHLNMNRTVALKVIRKELLEDTEVVARFYREMRVIGRLSHPHVVHAYDAGPVGGVHLIVMEYIEGTDLNRLVKQSGPLPVAQACEYVRQAALGLQHAHEQGLVHRDIKPPNLLLARVPGGFGTVKVADLGLARLRKRTGDQSLSSTLTPFGSGVMGTPDYLAPEQALDFHGADIRADIYSLGCTLFYLLTGQPPFPSGTLTEKLVRHQESVPPDLERFRADVPARVTRLLWQMLAKQPENRCQTPAEVAEALVRVVEGPHQTGPGTRPNRRRWLVGAGACGALALGGLAIRVLRPKAPADVNPLSSIVTPSPGAASQSPLDQLTPELVTRGTMTVAGRNVPLKAITWQGNSGLTTMDIRRDGALVAAVTAEGTLRLWDVTNWKTRSLPQSSGGAWVAFSPDLRTVASGGGKGKENVVRLWDLSEAAGPVDLEGHTSQVSCGVFSTSGLLATGDTGGNVNFWDLAPNRKPTPVSLGRHLMSVLALAFARDGRTFAWGGGAAAPAGSDVLLWNMAANRMGIPVESRGGARAIALAPDSKTLVVGRVSSDEAELYDATTGKRKNGVSLKANSNKTLRSVAYSPDGTLLASAGHPGTTRGVAHVVLWDVAAGAKRLEWELPSPPSHRGLAFAPDGRHLLVAAGSSVYVLRLDPPPRS